MSKGRQQSNRHAAQAARRAVPGKYRVTGRMRVRAANDNAPAGWRWWQAYALTAALGALQIGAALAAI